LPTAKSKGIFAVYPSIYWASTDPTAKKADKIDSKPILNIKRFILTSHDRGPGDFSELFCPPSINAMLRAKSSEISASIGTEIY
jgi:hypothetical protein